MAEAAAGRWPGEHQRGDEVEFRLGGGLVSWRPGTLEETVLYGRHQHYTVRDGAGRLHQEVPATGVRRPKRARKLVAEHTRAERGPARSERYLVWVRTHPCLLCHRPGPSDAHHYGPRGLGQKTDDYRTVPLCRGCHDAVHSSPVKGQQPLYRAQVDLLVRWLCLEGGEA